MGCASRMSASPSSTGRAANIPTRMSRGINGSSALRAWWKLRRIATKHLPPGRGSNKALDIFPDQVGFQIDGIAGLAIAERGDLQRLRDYPQVKTFSPS